MPKPCHWANLIPAHESRGEWAYNINFNIIIPLFGTTHHEFPNPLHTLNPHAPHAP